MSPNVLLLSIHQEYASMIFDGSKQVEFRRVKPRHLTEGDLIVVYVTSPRKALVGVLEVEKVVEKPTEELWQLVKDKAGINYECFQEYYENSTSAIAIFLRKPIPFNRPIHLEILREKWSDFRPPQSYHYLKDTEINILEAITNSNILSLSEKIKVHQTELLTQS